MDPLDDESPISNVGLEASADRLSKAWRVVRKRAPKALNRKIRLLLAQVFATVQANSMDMQARLALARELERTDSELHARVDRPMLFYVGDGKLAIVRIYEPVRIRGAVRMARLDAAFERYVAPAVRLAQRVNYFLARAGVETEEAKTVKPWEQPYANMHEYHELLWGKIQRMKSHME